ncbi:MAG: TlpA family protein disulfide reductase [Ekhidna sp.]|nr:TlpA family protein disulfide reductase [Ekhidna sp.]
MKRVLLILLVTIAFYSKSEAQKTLPSIAIENLEGRRLSASQIEHDGPLVLNFWATWCKPCVQELTEIQDQYDDWIDETNVKVIAISIDDTRSANKVNGFATGRGWDFEIYLDKNSDLKRALNINNIPYTVLLNSSGEIVWRHAGYTPGDEEVLYEKLVKLAE